jgi:hypothetical protein
MTIETWERLTSIIQSVVTFLSIIVAGSWAYRRFIIQQERYPNINFTADINIIGKQNNEWVLELIAFIENKGKVQHKIKKFNFDLNAIFKNENLTTSDEWGGQVDFTHPITEGSFLPQATKFFFVDPGTTAKYSYIAKLPDDASFAILHCYFKYSDWRKYAHTAEKTIKLP